MKVFSDKLRELRKQKELTQKGAAELLGVSATCYAGYEQGYREPDLEMLTKICRAFDVSADYLLGLTEDRDGF